MGGYLGKAKDRPYNFMVKRHKVVIVLNTAWNLVNFRAGLIRALVAAGFEVVAVAPANEYARWLESLGCRYTPLPMDNNGIHPGRDLLLLWRLFCLMKNERPAVFLGYTVKPNVYGSLAAHALKVPVINNIAGLGTVFIKTNWLTWLVRCLYRLALSRSKKIFFQNEDDRNLFVGSGLVRFEQTDRLPGSGIDLARFAPERMPLNGECVRFLLIARMLWDKGVGEYIEAARMVLSRYPQAKFFLLGFLDVKNPAAISREQIATWVDEGVVTYLGETDDVRPHITAADCIVLPSYREGVPRTLLEAAAMGRPIITTDAVGCRETVEDGVNGYLCQLRDASDLAKKMDQMITLSPEERTEMGRKGRKKVEMEFDEQFVVKRYLEVIGQIIEKPGSFKNT